MRHWCLCWPLSLSIGVLDSALLPVLACTLFRILVRVGGEALLSWVFGVFRGCVAGSWMRR